MSLFSSFFRGSSKEGFSYVRRWAEKRQREFRDLDILSPENLFAAMMYGLSSFGRKDNISSKLNGLGLDASKHYSGDGALFELGCYMYFRIDIWLHQHKPHHREDISTIFAKEFVALFTQALSSRDIPALFDNRISQYAKLAQTGADAEEYHYHLSQLIKRTRDNKLPEFYDFGNEPLMITGFFDDMGVKVALAAWEAGMIPALTKNLEMYCDTCDSPECESCDVITLRKAAEQGDMEAQVALGRIYSCGEGVPQDDKEAVKWFRKAAEQGHQQSQAILGGMYSLGQGVPQDDKEAVKWYKKAAEQGYGSAQCMLGTMYAEGQGVQQNDKEALKWYQKAEQQGDVNAQRYLGEMYSYGKGVLKNYKESVKWFRKAAEKGDAEAQRYLAVRYANGQGVSQDYKEAAKWYKKAAEQGIAYAQYELGRIYYNGEGLPKDYEESIKWVRRVEEKAKEGDPEAQLCLCGVTLCGLDEGLEPPELNKNAAIWYRDASECATEGEIQANYFLGMLYDSGLGVLCPDEDRVFKWFKKVSKKGWVPARHLYILGEMCYLGQGVRQDLREAVRFFKKAAEQGFAPAQDRLADFKPEFLKECDM